MLIILFMSAAIGGCRGTYYDITMDIVRGDEDYFYDIEVSDPKFLYVTIMSSDNL